MSKVYMVFPKIGLENPKIRGKAQKIILTVKIDIFF
jgi:hypothetical protein